MIKIFFFIKAPCQAVVYCAMVLCLFYAVDARGQSSAQIEISQAKSKREALEKDVERARQILLKQLKKAANEGLVSMTPEGDTLTEDVSGEDIELKREGREGLTAAELKAQVEARFKDSLDGDDQLLELTDDFLTPIAEEEPDTPSEPEAKAEPVAAARNDDAPKKQEPAAQATLSEDKKNIPEPITDQLMAEFEEDLFPDNEEAITTWTGCLPDEKLDPRLWLSEEDFFVGLGKRRTKVFNALNEPQKKAVVQLMEYYIGFGLGFEASVIPTIFDVDNEDTRLLADIGRILEHRSPSRDGPFGRPYICAGRHGLWIAAAHALTRPQKAVAAYRASGRALARTPTALRRKIGARIGRAAIAAKDLPLAKDILALLNRSATVPDPEQLLLMAMVAQADGRRETAITIFQGLSEGRAHIAPAAKIRLSRLLRPPFDRQQARDLANMLIDDAFQSRGSPQEIAMIKASVQLKNRFGGLASALEDVEFTLRRRRALGRRRSVGLARLRLDLIGDAISHLDAPHITDEQASVQAIELVAAIKSLPPGAMEDALRLSLASHLLRKRSAALAKLVVDKNFAGRSEEAAYLRARALNPPGAGAIAMAKIELPKEAFDEAAFMFEDESGNYSEEVSPSINRMEELASPIPEVGRGPSGEPSLIAGEELLRQLERDIRLIRETATDG